MAGSLLLAVLSSACADRRPAVDFEDELVTARELVRGGEAERAWLLLERLAREHPERAEVYPLLASTASRLGRPEAAIPLLEQAVAKGGADAHLILDPLGTLLEETDRWEEAETRYREALAVAPGYPPPYRKLSRVMERRGRYAEALEVARDGIEAAPASPGLRAWLAELLLDRQRFTEAEAELRRSLALEGAGAYPRYLLGLVYLHLERPAEARAELEIAVEEGPEIWEGWYQLANACDRLGEIEARDAALARFEALYRRRLEETR